MNARFFFPRPLPRWTTWLGLPFFSVVTVGLSSLGAEAVDAGAGAVAGTGAGTGAEAGAGTGVLVEPELGAPGTLSLSVCGAFEVTPAVLP